jgi:hypothetical protein
LVTGFGFVRAAGERPAEHQPEYMLAEIHTALVYSVKLSRIGWFHFLAF